MKKRFTGEKKKRVEAVVGERNVRIYLEIQKRRVEAR